MSTDISEVVTAAVAATGLTPEYIALVLKRSEITDAEFLEELRRQGHDIRTFEVDAERTRQECDESRRKAKRLLDFFTDENNLFAYGDEIDAVMGETLDHSSIFYFMELVAADAKSASAAAAAHKKHAENRSMRDQVFKWCDANLNEFRSMDAAAEAVAGKLVPITFRTVPSRTSATSARLATPTSTTRRSGAAWTRCDATSWRRWRH